MEIGLLAANAMLLAPHNKWLATRRDFLIIAVDDVQTWSGNGIHADFLSEADPQVHGINGTIGPGGVLTQLVLAKAILSGEKEWQEVEIGQQPDIAFSCLTPGMTSGWRNRLQRALKIAAQRHSSIEETSRQATISSRVHEEIAKCHELLALFTPWSRRRAWVRHEIGMADVLKKRIVCVFYKVTVADFQGDEDGLGPLDGLNIVEINDLGTYFKAVRRRAR